MKNKKVQTLGSILVVIGAILIAVIGIISTWGDIEATVFNSAIKSKDPLPSLRCPAIITPKDDAFVSASINNPSDRDLEMEIRTFVSDGYVFMMKEIITNFSLKSGESEVVHVPINVNDAAYNRVVLVRMHQISRGPLPYMNASCGVIVANIPFITGTHLVILVISLGTLLSGVGLILWKITAKPITSEQSKTLKFYIFFLLLTYAVCFAGLSGLWLLAVLLIIVWILMGVGKISQLALRDIEKP